MFEYVIYLFAIFLATLIALGHEIEYQKQREQYDTVKPHCNFCRRAFFYSIIGCVICLFIQIVMFLFFLSHLRPTH